MASTSVSAPTSAPIQVVTGGSLNKGPAVTQNYNSAAQAATAAANNATAASDTAIRTGNATAANTSGVIQTTTAQRVNTANNVSMVNGITGSLTAAATPAVNTNSTTPTSNTTSTPSTPTNPTNPGYGNTGTTTAPVSTTGTTTTPANNGTTTTPPAGTVSTGKDASGNTTYLDASGNPIDTSTTPEDNGSAVPGSDYFNTQVAAITQAGSTQMAALATTLQQTMALSDSLTQSTIAQVVAQTASQSASITQAYTGLVASKSEQSARLGLDQTSPDQAAGVLTNIQTIEQGKLADLNSKMLDAVQKAQTSLQEGDMKAFNDTSDQIKAIQTAMATSVKSLYTAAQDYTKAQMTAATATQKAVSDSVALAKNLAPSIAGEIAGMSAADQKTVISQMATEYNVDPSLLEGYVTNAATTANQKATSSANAATNASNTQATAGLDINAKQGGGVDGDFKYSGSDKSNVESDLTSGGTFDGTKYNGTGKDGYVDPDLYMAELQGWKTKGGTQAGFLKLFPPTDYINPADNANLPTWAQNISSTAQQNEDAEGGSGSSSSTGF